MLLDELWLLIGGNRASDLVASASSLLFPTTSPSATPCNLSNSSQQAIISSLFVSGALWYYWWLLKRKWRLDTTATGGASFFQHSRRLAHNAHNVRDSCAQKSNLKLRPGSPRNDGNDENTADMHLGVSLHRLRRFADDNNIPRDLTIRALVRDVIVPLAKEVASKRSHLVRNIIDLDCKHRACSSTTHARPLPIINSALIWMFEEEDLLARHGKQPVSTPNRSHGECANLPPTGLSPPAVGPANVYVSCSWDSTFGDLLDEVDILAQRHRDHLKQASTTSGSSSTNDATSMVQMPDSGNPIRDWSDYFTEARLQQSLPNDPELYFWLDFFNTDLVFDHPSHVEHQTAPSQPASDNGLHSPRVSPAEIPVSLLNRAHAAGRRELKSPDWWMQSFPDTVSSIGFVLMVLPLSFPESEQDNGSSSSSSKHDAAALSAERQSPDLLALYEVYTSALAAQRAPSTPASPPPSLPTTIGADTLPLISRRRRPSLAPVNVLAAARVTGSQSHTPSFQHVPTADAQGGQPAQSSHLSESFSASSFEPSIERAFFSLPSPQVLPFQRLLFKSVSELIGNHIAPHCRLRAAVTRASSSAPQATLTTLPIQTGIATTLGQHHFEASALAQLKLWVLHQAATMLQDLEPSNSDIPSYLADVVNDRACATLHLQLASMCLNDFGLHRHSIFHFQKALHFFSQMNPESPTTHHHHSHSPLSALLHPSLGSAFPSPFCELLDIHIGMGDAFMAMHDPASAIRAYQKALELLNSMSSKEPLAGLLVEDGPAQQADQLATPLAKTHSRIGDAYTELGDASRAQAAYDQALLTSATATAPVASPPANSHLPQPVGVAEATTPAPQVHDGWVLLPHQAHERIADGLKYLADANPTAATRSFEEALSIRSSPQEIRTAKASSAPQSCPDGIIHLYMALGMLKASPQSSSAHCNSALSKFTSNKSKFLAAAALYAKGLASFLHRSPNSTAADADADADAEAEKCFAQSHKLLEGLTAGARNSDTPHKNTSEREVREGISPSALTTARAVVAIARGHAAHRRHDLPSAIASYESALTLLAAEGVAPPRASRNPRDMITSVSLSFLPQQPLADASPARIVYFPLCSLDNDDALFLQACIGALPSLDDLTVCRLIALHSLWRTHFAAGCYDDAIATLKTALQPFTEPRDKKIEAQKVVVVHALLQGAAAATHARLNKFGEAQDTIEEALQILAVLAHAPSGPAKTATQTKKKKKKSKKDKSTRDTRGEGEAASSSLTGNEAATAAGLDAMSAFTKLAYARLLLVRASIASSSTGNHARALEMVTTATNVLDTILPEPSSGSFLHAEIVRALNIKGGLLSGLARFHEAQSAHLAALQILDIITSPNEQAVLSNAQTSTTSGFPRATTHSDVDLRCYLTYAHHGPAHNEESKTFEAEQPRLCQLLSASCLEGLARASLGLWSYQSAQEYAEEAIALRQRWLHAQDADLGCAYQVLGLALYHRGRVADARNMFGLAIDALTSTHAQHPLLLLCRCYRANASASLNQELVGECARVHREQLSLARSFLPERHPEIAALAHLHGALHQRAGPTDALGDLVDSLLFALSVRVELYGETHIWPGETHKVLGDLYFLTLRQPHEALAHYVQAQACFQYAEATGEWTDHAMAVDMYNAMGVIHFSQCASQEAHDCFSTVASLRVVINGTEETLESAAAHNNLALTLKKMRRFQPALPHYERAIAITHALAKALASKGGAAKSVPPKQPARDSNSNGRGNGHGNGAAEREQDVALMRLEGGVSGLGAGLVFITHVGLEDLSMDMSIAYRNIALLYKQLQELEDARKNIDRSIRELLKAHSTAHPKHAELVRIRDSLR